MCPIFRRPDIIFKDITPILSNGKLFRASIDVFLEQCRGKEIDKIVGIDARGFLFGSAVAYELGIGFVPLRKKGRLPYKTESAKYSLEYGEAEMELHIDAIERGEKIVLIDDLLATGGTSASAAALIKKVGGVLAGSAVSDRAGVPARPRKAGASPGGFVSEVLKRVVRMSSRAAQTGSRPRRSADLTRAISIHQGPHGLAAVNASRIPEAVQRFRGPSPSARLGMTVAPGQLS